MAALVRQEMARFLAEADHQGSSLTRGSQSNGFGWYSSMWLGVWSLDRGSIQGLEDSGLAASVNNFKASTSAASRRTPGV